MPFFNADRWAFTSKRGYIAIQKCRLSFFGKVTTPHVRLGYANTPGTINGVANAPVTAWRRRGPRSVSFEQIPPKEFCAAVFHSHRQGDGRQFRSVKQRYIVQYTTATGVTRSANYFMTSISVAAKIPISSCRLQVQMFKFINSPTCAVQQLAVCLLTSSLRS